MEEQFNKIFELYNKDVYRLIFSYTMDYSEAKDILQETFLRYYKNMDKLPEDHVDVKKWLFKVSINISKDYLRRIIKYRFFYKDELEQYKSNEKNDLDFIDILERLNIKYRIPIFLYYYEGYKIEEIAELLNMKVSAVKMRLSRAKIILKKEMESI